MSITPPLSKLRRHNRAPRLLALLFLVSGHPAEHVFARGRIDSKKCLLVGQRSSRGFTLVELLVVMAIIAILAALSMAVTSSLQKRANTAQDIGRIKQYGVALNLMFTENRVIRAADIIRGGSTLIDDYAGGPDEARKLLNSKVWVETTKNIPIFQGRRIDETTRSYTLNESLFPRMAPTEDKPSPAPWALDPTTPIKLRDKPNKPLLFTGVYNPSHNGAYVWGSVAHTSPVFSGAEKPKVDRQSLGKTLVLFVGGHVRIVDFESENLPVQGPGADPGGWWKRAH